MATDNNSTKQITRDKSSFCLQLRLLLWKNFTIKKRSPFVFLLEVLIPLTLFIILVLIRKNKKGIPISIEHYSPMPLPSAGVIPVIQSFCNKKDGDDVYSANNTRLSSFLQEMQTVLTATDPTLPHFTPDTWDRLVPYLSQTVAKWNNYSEALQGVQDLPIRSVLRNVTQYTTLLQSKYKLTGPEVTTLLGASLNITKMWSASPEALGSLVDSDDMAADLVSGLLAVTSLEDSLKTSFLTPTTMKTFLCGSDMDVFIADNAEATELTQKTVQTLICNTGGVSDFVTDTIDFIDYRSVVQQLDIPDQLYTQPTWQQLGNINTSEARSLLQAVRTMRVALQHIPATQCNALRDNTPGSTHDTPTPHKKVTSFDRNLTTVEDKYSAIVDYWRLLKPVMCGHDEDEVTKSKHNATENIKQDDDILTSGQKKDLQILTHLLYNNPKVLYAPNNTAANKIIQKVNTSFRFYGNISSYAREWLNSSSRIRTILKHLKLPRHYSKVLTATVSSFLDDVDNLACTWLSLTSGVDFDIFRGFASEAELEDYFLNKQYHDNVTVIAGLVFENLNDSSADLPAHFRYKIRQNATLNPPTSQIRKSFWFPSPGTNDLKYYTFGFVWIQDVIERAVIDLQTGNDVTDPGAYLKRMPYPCWLWDGFIWLIQHNMPLCLMLSWIYMVAMLVQRIVYEKEKGLKEVMKMMGLSNAVHWCAWFITAFVQMTLTVVTLTLMLHFGHILVHSDPMIVFVFLELFAISSIAMSFAISSLYSKAKLAAACAGIFYFLTYVPYIYIAIQEDVSLLKIPASAKTAASIFSTSALALGGKYFLFYEIDGVGVQWDNVMVSPMENDTFCLQTIMVMMVFDTVIYLLLAWYIENVHPGTYGLPKPWYFPLQPSYWGLGKTESSYTCSVKQLFGIRDKSRQHIQLDNDDDGDEDLILRANSNDYIEEEDENAPIGVSVVNLTKVYGKDRPPAVKNLSMTLYEDQITSFLGHNGAGKTTTMSLLTGLFPPTSGDAFINGSSILTDMDTIRLSLGICPQHNVLFESLTVEEHLWFYARLKGMQAEDIYMETARVLNDLGIAKKRRVQPSCLSGGMQRKLSVAMAFVGGSRTVILDEPTAGVDPNSRRAIWTLLNEYKKGRTILLSTHHMDEAEVLGDKVIIISNGELKCAGSSTFLKSLLGDGQHLHIIKNDLSLKTIDTATVDSTILKRVQAIIPTAKMHFSSSSEIHIILPLTGPDKSKLAEVIDMIHNDGASLEIQSYGITDGGLEDVFIKITEETLQKDDLSKSVSSRYDGTPSNYDTGDLYLHDLSDSRPDVQEDCQLLDLGQSSNHQHGHTVTYYQGALCGHLRHITALITKRFYYTVRNRKSIISQIILPAIFVSISMTIALSAPKETDPPPLTMSPSQYFNLTQPKGNFVPYYYKKSASINARSKNAGPMDLVRTFQMPSGIGATCVLKSAFHSAYESDMIRHLNVSAKHFELFEKYFNRNCSGVFTPGVQVEMYVPPSSSIRPGNSTETKKSANITLAKYYPYCQCLYDHTGFACSSDGYVDPPSRSVVTRDVLQDISGTDEEDFYLYTTNRYVLHRYGGFSFGSGIPYAPDDMSSDQTGSPILDRLVVKEMAQVRFNKKGYHSIPVYLNALNNAILRANLPKTKGHPAAYGITLVNHPMKKTNNLLDMDYIQGGTDVLMAIFIIVAMAFVPASFVVFLVHERSIKAKHLQFVSGVNPVTYWISNYIWDMCNYLIPAACIVVILIAFHIPAYTEKENFQAVVSLFLLYGWSITPMMYPASFLFKESSVAYILLIVLNLFTGITCVVTSYLLEQFSYDKELRVINDHLKAVFLVFPNYCLGNGLMEIALNHYKNEFYSHTGLYDRITSPWEWNITGRRLVVMAITGLVFFVITILYESKLCLKIRKSETTPKTFKQDEDNDVEAERERTLYGIGRTDMLRIKNLKKVYKSRRGKRTVAVDGLTFAVPRGECFGLLGVNGAGKTTTFKMLTGDIKPTCGDANLESYSIHRDLRKVQQNIGYCPQFDALLNELTPTEHLQLYARLRGIHPKEELQAVQNVIEKLALTKYARQPAGTLSGGNKRKISTAISLIGKPSLILMDEPTTGMDPYSRRFLWKTIKDLVNEGTSILFTSHSMEECEYLCSRLSIIVNGQLKCLGSPQHLKHKFGDGYTLKVLMQNERDFNNVVDHLTRTIVDCRYVDKSYRTLIFEVNTDCRELAGVYRVMDHACHIYQIKDYSLSQNTLDNVFIKFAKHQTGVGDTEEDHVPADTATADTHHDIETSVIREEDDEPLLTLSPNIGRLEIMC